MARSIINDLLQNHRFWLFDVVPSATLPFYVLGSPVYAFSAITAPEYTFDTREVKQMNSMFKRTVYEGGSMGTMTLSRGARVYDDTFYEWVKRAIEGTDSINRTLMLIQYTGASMLGEAAAKAEKVVNVVQSIAGGVQNPLRGVGRFEDLDRNYALNVPGRAWVLFDCVPTRYRTGSDFDATDASVSIMELEMAVESFTEIALLGSGP
jgi:phage tail-like protein